MKTPTVSVEQSSLTEITKKIELSTRKPMAVSKYKQNVPDVTEESMRTKGY